MADSTRYDLMVFDLDGTLIDSLLDLTMSVNHTLSQFGLPFRTVAEVRSYIGEGVVVLMRKALGKDHEDKLDDALRVHGAYYADHAIIQTRVYPGVIETLEHFSDATKVVYTNKPQVPCERALEYLGLMRFFDGYYGDGSGVTIKPDPAGLLMICERHGARTGRTVMIGDGDTDVLAAQRAGIDVYAATYGFRGRERLAQLNPTGLFDSFAELRDILG